MLTCFVPIQQVMSVVSFRLYFAFGIRFVLGAVLLLATSLISPDLWATTRGALTPDGIFKRYKEAVVRIEVLLHGASLGVGSGFFISKTGEIATSLHVVRPWLTHPEAEIRVRTAGGQVLRQVQVGNCGDSRGIDLCLLKVAALPKAILPPSMTAVTPGESIVTIGHPRGLDFSISTGIVSAIRENPSGWNEVQIDAAISPGNSGGPIINSNGQAVGVVYQFERDGQNLNFGITSDELSKLLSQGEDNSRNTYLKIADARRTHLERGRRISKRAIDKLIRPAIQSMNTSTTDTRPSGFKWMRASLDEKSFLMLVPEVLQSCERSDEGAGVAATSCSSNGGDLILTIQRRPRTLEGSMVSYRGRRLVVSRHLSVVDRLESEGQWEKIKPHERAFLSRPSPAKCQSFTKSNGQSAVVASDEGSNLAVRMKGFFEKATAICRFETENDSEPGAISFSQWIEYGTEFYGINVWTADPSRLSFAQSLADLVLVSAGAQADDASAKPYRLSLRPGLKRKETGIRGRWIPAADHYDFFQDEISAIAIGKTTAVVPSQMNRSFTDWVVAIAKANGLRLTATGTASLESTMSHTEVAGQNGRIGSWVATSVTDRSKSYMIHLAASYGSDSTWVIAEVERLGTAVSDERYSGKAAGATRQIATATSPDVIKSLQNFRKWVQEFEPISPSNSNR